jgi:outer membrane immunogenic protein
MITLRAALVTALSVLATAVHTPQARAVELDQVLKRLESLERENATLRNRLERLETGRRAERSAAPAVAPAPVSASPSPLAAHAAVSTYAAVPSAPVYNWSGFYFGAHGGGVWQTDALTDTFTNCLATCAVAPAIREIKLDGFVAGLHAGWNYQVGHLVVGTEGSLAWAKRDGARTDTLTNVLQSGATRFTSDESHTWTHRADWLATATARFGFAWNNYLLYSKGGVAVTQNRYTLTDVVRQTTQTALASSTSVVTTNAIGSDTRVGYLVGFGGQWGFWGNWSASLEYNFVDFGTDMIRMSGRVTTTPLTVFNNTVVEGAFPMDQQLHLLKAGLTYRFGPSATP